MMPIIQSPTRIRKDWANTLIPSQYWKKVEPIVWSGSGLIIDQSQDLEEKNLDQIEKSPILGHFVGSLKKVLAWSFDPCPTSEKDQVNISILAQDQKKIKLIFLTTNQVLKMIEPIGILILDWDQKKIEPILGSNAQPCLHIHTLYIHKVRLEFMNRTSANRRLRRVLMVVLMARTTRHQAGRRLRRAL